MSTRYIWKRYSYIKTKIVGPSVFSTAAISFENKSHFITDTITLFSQLLIWCDHRLWNNTLNKTLICNLLRDWKYFASK